MIQAKYVMLAGAFLIHSPILSPILGADRPVDYVQDVKPVLKERCYACHGVLKQEGGLRLDTAEFVRRGGDSGPAVMPGESDESLLIEAITGDVDLWRMPPEGEPLEPEQIAALSSWIDAGVEAPADEEPEPDPAQHWAFQPIQRPPVPELDDRASVRNPIDAFIAEGRRRHGVTAVEEADRAVLLRRVMLDLIGLPPSPKELAEFLDDSSPNAYERLVDSLLDRPEYGERWARHWMDVWRYSDWYGRRSREELRNSQRHIWRWRDWIVESLNEGKGYDRMIVEMLAADELAADDPDLLRATGYLARNYHRTRNRWMEDTLEYASMSFLGLTLGCARCHDHKYDPISQRDYYQMRAVFEPHDVRTDRVPGEPDLMKDGLARVFDASPNAKTFLFRGGDPQSIDRSAQLAPGIPEFLNFVPFEIEPVDLPVAGYYPELAKVFQEEERAAGEKAVSQARKERNVQREKLAGIRRQIDELTATLGEESGEEGLAGRLAGLESERDLSRMRADLAGQKLEAAEAELAAIEARIAADNARFADPPAGAEVEKTVHQALSAERAAAVLRGHADVAQAEHQVQQLADEPKKNAGAGKQTLAAAKKELAQARKALKEAELAAANAKGDYTPLGNVHPARSTGRRSALAEWITHPENPLTARVGVNHIWKWHFGRPLTDSVEDLGRNGRSPSHPELLDWLAAEWIERGWDMKHLHRLIVTSTTYRLQSTAGQNAESAAIDPDNVRLWRMNPRRMEAEVVRDSLLAVSGALDPTMGGPDIEPQKGESLPRRSLYFRHAGDGQMTLLEVFDVANPNECFRRADRVVPHQALALANSRLGFVQSRRIAANLSKQVGTRKEAEANEAFIAAAFESLFTRKPNREERGMCLEFLDRQEGLYEASSGDGGEAPHIRARTSLVHVLINHNDFVTIH